MKKLNLSESSNVIAAEYNSSYEVLVVTFKRGIKYQYNDVPQDIISEWESRNAEGESTGQLFNSLIKPVFEAVRL